MYNIGKMIPLILKIKKETHKSIAQAQDILMQEVYHVFDTAVFHGGTAIWRCYGGNRFSEDVDFYFPKSKEKLDLLFENIQKLGFTIEKKKISERSLYSDLVWNRTHVRLEGIFKKVDGHLREYATVEGNLISVYTLTPEEFVAEKVAAYLGRRKIRDLYDIFFLLRFADRSVVRSLLAKLIAQFEPPIDESDLKVIILGGLVPNSKKMIEYIHTWAK